MSIATATFLLFSLVTVVAYNIFQAGAWRQLVLLAANLYFLSTFSHDLLSFAPLAAFLAVGFAGMRLMQAGWRRGFVPILGLEILILIWLKKYAFLPEASFLTFSYVTLGMSYITFRLFHLLIDAKDATLPPVTLVSYLNYTLSFLTLVSGPIQRYEEFAATHLAAVRPPLGLKALGTAAERIVIGFFKVSLLSLVFLQLHEQGISELAAANSVAERFVAGLLVVGAYPIFLYTNFSGYMDIVIGVGRCLRFTLPENFDRPFAAPNFMLFWNRWHITLSAFFKTYVFNPLLLRLMDRLGGRSIEPFLAVIAFFVTFLLLGVWHGQTSEFVVYGLVLGLGVSLNKLFQVILNARLGAKRYKQLARNGAYTAACRGLTFTYFTFSLVFFWSSWRQLGELLGHLDAISSTLIWIGLWIAATAVLALAEALREWTRSWRLAGETLVASRYFRTALATAVIVVTVAITTLLSAPAPENVYRAF